MIEIEFHIQGRNDDYEPDWAAKVEAAIEYNHRLCRKYGIDLKIAFSEWNPPEGKPLLSPKWAARWPFFRGVVVEPALHHEMAKDSPLTMLISPAINVLLRSCETDYFLVSAGDIFLGRSTVQAIRDNGLKPATLYRAERVNIDAGLDFRKATPDMIEDPGNIRKIDSCSEPPNNQPPFTNASGDFIMFDRATFRGFRGFDESVTTARLHIDRRCVMQSHLIGLPAVLLGRIYHIFHTQSYANPKQTRVSRILYNHKDNLPFLNPDNWGLWDRTWERTHDRIWHVKPGKEDAATQNARTKSLSGEEAAREAHVWQQINDVKRATQPLLPEDEKAGTEKKLAIRSIREHNKKNGAEVTRTAEGFYVTTAPLPWSYTLQLGMNAPEPLREDMHYWLQFDMHVEEGQASLVLIHKGEKMRRTFFPSVDQPEAHAMFPLELPQGANEWDIVIENGGSDNPARLTLKAARLFAYPKN